MKKILFLVSTTIILSSCANRLGDLSMLSNRNYDNSQKYVLLQRDVKVKVKTKKNDVIERGVDKATSSVRGGEFLMNATLWVSPGGKKLKIKADVWGIQKEEAAPTANALSTAWKVGDKVQWKELTKTFKGEITDLLNEEIATVKDESTGKLKDVKYKNLRRDI